MKKPVILLGAGGHARVLLDVLRLQGIKILGLTDANPSKADKTELKIPVLGDDEAILNYRPEEVFLVNGIGSTDVDSKRAELFKRFKTKSYTFVSVVHPSAIIARDVVLGEGVQIMAGAVIQTGARIGDNTIINTRAAIDHDCEIGSSVHIAPGVTLSGGITVGDGTHIGTGAVIVQNRRIGRNCFVKAQALIREDLPDGKTVHAASGSKNTLQKDWE